MKHFNKAGHSSTKGASGEPWCREQVVDPARQAYLKKQLAITVDITSGRFPFRGVKLSRADVEWLLVTHTDGHGKGSIDWKFANEREREGLDLRGADLSQVDLSSLPLACLRGGLTGDERLHASPEQAEAAAVNLRNADLSEVHLEGAELSYACLMGARLEQAHLEDSFLNRAHFEGANLTHAHLERANLIEASFERASLWEAQLQESLLIDANLTNANLTLAQLQGANLARAMLKDTCLTKAHLERADLSGANLKCAVLVGAHLEYADFAGWHPPTLPPAEEGKERQLTHLELADLSLAHLEGAFLTDAYLVGSILIGAHLDHAVLVGAKLMGAKFQLADLKEASLEQTNLAGADLRQTHLEGANLRQAYLASADLSAEVLQSLRELDSNFPEVLPPADLRSAYFDSSTNLEGAILSKKYGESHSHRSFLVALTNLKTTIPGQKGNKAKQEHGSITLADANWNNVNFAVIDWAPIKHLGDEHIALQKRSHDGHRKAKAIRIAEYEAAARANRQLALALEQQGMDEEAARFAFKAQNLRRALLWRQMVWQGKVARTILPYIFSWVLYILAGYRMQRILGAYITLIVVFAVIYYFGMQPGPSPITSVKDVVQSIFSQRFFEAIIISITAFHGRVFSTPFAAGAWLQSVPAFEAICGFVLEGVFIAMLAKRLFGK